MNSGFASTCARALIERRTNIIGNADASALGDQAIKNGHVCRISSAIRTFPLPHHAWIFSGACSSDGWQPLTHVSPPFRLQTLEVTHG
jgi:hypothetical protein